MDSNHILFYNQAFGKLHDMANHDESCHQFTTEVQKCSDRVLQGARSVFVDFRHFCTLMQYGSPFSL